MTIEKHKKAKELLERIQELESYIKRVEDKYLVDDNINIELGNYRIPLYSDFLPMSSGDFVKMCLMKAKKKISELREEFDNL